jgi:16S rRNA (cytosine967-C5)-methyltransferase
MRRAAEDPPALLAGFEDGTPAGAAIAHSYPLWLAEMWWRELGPADARLLMAAMNEPAETAFRVNTLRAAPGALAAELAQAGVELRRAGKGLLAPAESLVVGRAGEPVRARVLTGELVPQSRASLAVVEVLDPRPGERILDLCAGPGIKTTAIAARMKDRGELVAVEHDERRAREIEELSARAGAASVRVQVADAAEADLGSGYDRVLVDPPCSDLGTLASRPDARWRKSPQQIERLAVLQRRILVRAARALRSGGTLVLSTCTLSAQENEHVADALERLAPGLVADKLGGLHPELASRRDRRFLQIRPDRDRTTGFFIARFRRTG